MAKSALLTAKKDAVIPAREIIQSDHSNLVKFLKGLRSLNFFISFFYGILMLYK